MIAGLSGFRQSFFEALIKIDHFMAAETAEKACRKIQPMAFIDNVVTPVLTKLGNDWERGNLSLTHIYLGGLLCEEIIESILPPEGTPRANSPRMAVVTLMDSHPLGKKIVLSVLRSAGYRPLDYGHSIPPEEVVERALTDRLEMILISVLMYPSAIHIQRVRELLRKMNASIKIIVGGAPFNFDTHLWKKVGADAMGSSAGDAISLVENIHQGKKYL